MALYSSSHLLAQLQLGEELYKAIVEIYVYFLHFDPNRVKEGSAPKPGAGPEQAERKEQEE